MPGPSCQMTRASSANAAPTRWHRGLCRLEPLRYGLSYRDVEELLAERGVVVDHVTVYRWVQRFTPMFVDAARPCRHSPVTAGSSMRPTSRSPADGAT